MLIWDRSSSNGTSNKLPGTTNKLEKALLPKPESYVPFKRLPLSKHLLLKSFVQLGWMN
jgi:hypothetical protein